MTQVSIIQYIINLIYKITSNQVIHEKLYIGLKKIFGHFWLNRFQLCNKDTLFGTKTHQKISLVVNSKVLRKESYKASQTPMAPCSNSGLSVDLMNPANLDY